MRNEIIYDAAGVPDVMVVFTPDELGLPATIKGRKVAEYLIGKYQATLIDGVPHSLPYQKPAVDINHDEAIRLCESKGEGWHLLTNDEWAALARWSWEHDTIPTGNTNSGKSHSHPEQAGTTYEGGYGKTLTGSGPIEWNHDRTPEGVADMVGNVWEHVGGIRFLNGQVQVIPNNEAAAGADQSKDSKEWTAIYTSDGDPIYYNPIDGEIFVQPHEAKEKDYDGDYFTNLHASELDVPDKLIELGLYPAPGYDSEEYFWIDNNGERVIYRGGYWGNGPGAGVFSLSGDYSRPYSYTAVGFRPALIRYSGNSEDLDHLDGDPTDLSNAPDNLKTTIQRNAEKLKNKEARRSPSAESLLGLPTIFPETLADMLRFVIARELTEIYKTAEGVDREKLAIAAYTATEDELKEAVTLASILAQLNITAAGMKQGMEQIKLAMTTTLTLRKDGTSHE